MSFARGSSFSLPESLSNLDHNRGLGFDGTGETEANESNRLNNWNAPTRSRKNTSEQNYSGKNLSTLNNTVNRTPPQTSEQKDERRYSRETSPENFYPQRHRTPATFPRTRVTPAISSREQVAMENLRQHLSFDGADDEWTRVLEKNEYSHNQRGDTGAAAATAIGQPQEHDKKVIDRLIQIREYIKQTSMMMEKLQSSSDPVERNRVSQLQQVLVRLQEQEQRCLGFLLQLKDKPSLSYNSQENFYPGEADQKFGSSFSISSSAAGDGGEASNINSEELEALKQQQHLLQTMLQQQEELRDLKTQHAALLALRKQAQDQLHEQQLAKAAGGDGVDPAAEAQQETHNNRSEERNVKLRNPEVIPPEAYDLRDKLELLQRKKNQMDALLQELNLIKNLPDMEDGDLLEEKRLKPSPAAAAAGFQSEAERRALEIKLQKLTDARQRLSQLRTQLTDRESEGQEDGESAEDLDQDTSSDVNEDTSASQYNSAKERLERLQGLLAVMQEPSLGSAKDESAEDYQWQSFNNQPEHKSAAPAAAVGGASKPELQTFPKDDQNMKVKQQKELLQLREERKKLLGLQKQLQRLHDTLPGPSVQQAAKNSAQELTPSRAPVQAAKKKYKSSARGNLNSVKSAGENSGVTFQEPLETVISNEELYGQMRQQRILREELRDKKRELEIMMRKDHPKKQYLRNQDNHSDNVSYSQKSDILLGSASQDHTMATWGSSTVDNVGSVEEEAAGSGGDGQEIEECDDAFPNDGIIQVEEEEEAGRSDDSVGQGTYTVETDGLVTGVGAPFQSSKSRVYKRLNYNYWASDRRKAGSKEPPLGDTKSKKTTRYAKDVEELRQDVQQLTKMVMGMSKQLDKDSKGEGQLSSMQQYLAQLQQQQFFISMSQMQNQLLTQHQQMNERLSVIEQSHDASNASLSSEPNKNVSNSFLLKEQPQLPQLNAAPFQFRPVYLSSDHANPIAELMFSPSDFDRGAAGGESLSFQHNSSTCDAAVNLSPNRQTRGSQTQTTTEFETASQSSMPGDEELPAEAENMSSTSDETEQNRGAALSAYVNEDNSNFDSVREIIYKEVAALISLNENRPYFLIRAFRDMQQLHNDYLRQCFLQALETTLADYIPQEETADKVQTGGAAYKKKEDGNIKTEEAESLTTSRPFLKKKENMRDWPHINTSVLDTQIKSIMTEVIPILKDQMDEVCTAQLLTYVKTLVLTLAQQLTNSNWIDTPECGRSFYNQLTTMLTDSLGKYQGHRMRDCGEDILVDLSEILFNEFAFFRMMQDLERTQQWPTGQNASSQEAVYYQDQAASTSQTNGKRMRGDEENEESDEETADIFQKSGCTAIEAASPHRIHIALDNSTRVNGGDVQADLGGSHLQTNQLMHMKLQLTSSETKPMNRIGSDEDTEEVDESADNEDPSDTAVAHSYHEEGAAEEMLPDIRDELSTRVFYQYSAPPIGAASAAEEVTDANAQTVNDEENGLTVDDLPRRITGLSKEALEQSVAEEQATQQSMSLQELVAEPKHVLAGDQDQIMQPGSNE